MKRISLFTFFIFLGIAGCMAQVSGEKIEKVYVAFKTHLDVGFTDLSSVVTERYVHDFIPKAIEVSERLRADGSGDRYVWTTGSWLIWKYLRTASPEAVKQLEEAIGRGDIVWNSVPYTVESETMTRELFETCLLLSKRLDKKYNKQTIAAKMTDVPGHTRSIMIRCMTQAFVFCMWELIQLVRYLRCLLSVGGAVLLAMTCCWFIRKIMEKMKYCRMERQLSVLILRATTTDRIAMNV